MKKKSFRPIALFLALALIILLRPVMVSQANDEDSGKPAPVLQTTGVFRNPVVPGATISGYFDHNPADDIVTFYDGRQNKSTAFGFYFSCNAPYMNDFVGCADNVAGEAACANNRELWYDQHHGTDYEFSANWHTGAYCDPGKFGNLTLPIYAPARGYVQYVGYNHQFNGNHMFILHDENGNGNFFDDGLRAAYLHFASLAVNQGQIVEEGQLLGMGGSTGYSSSPHLHFEVQRSYNNWSTRTSVDPYGWQGAGGDPWPGGNRTLWQKRVDYTNWNYLPSVSNGYFAGCSDCPNWFQNSGFEDGNAVWSATGVDVIANTGHPNLNITPYQGNWLAWLSGRNNATDELWQTFTVPSDATTATLSYWLYMSSEETDNGLYDAMSVRLRTGDGANQIGEDLDYITNTFSPRDQWVHRSVSLGDLSSYQGQTLQIRFKSTSDASAKTSFYLDEVQVQP